jgi:hypothetical protein
MKNPSVTGGMIKSVRPTMSAFSHATLKSHLLIVVRGSSACHRIEQFFSIFFPVRASN